jgi:membrane fusion protein, adhesin transport system
MAFDINILRRELSALYRLERRDFFRIIGFGLVQAILALIVPIAIGNLINAVSFGSLMQPVIVLTLIVLIFLGAGALVRLLQVWFIEALQRRLFIRVMGDAEARAGMKNDPDKVNYFLEVFTLQKSVVSLLTDGSTAFMAVVIGMVVISVYHPYFLYFNLILIFVAGYVAAYRYFRRGLPLSYEESDSKYAVFSWLQTALVGGKVRKPETSSSLQNLGETYLKKRSAFYSVVFKQHIALVSLHIVGSGIVLLLGGYLVIKKEMSLGQLVAAELIVSKMLDAISKFGKYFQSAYDTSDALLKLSKLRGGAAVDTSSQAESYEIHFKSFLTSRWQEISWRGYAVAFVSILVIVLVLPWQQTSYGEGRVVAFSPTDRQQTIEAPVSGRIAHWHVHEGSLVRKGDKLVSISDLDPQMTERLEQERFALSERYRAVRSRVENIESRVSSLQLSRSEAVSAAENRVMMASERVRQAQQILAAAEAALDTSRLNFERQKSLSEQGLTSQRSVELAELDFKKSKTDEKRAVAGLKSAEQEKKALQRDAKKLARDADAAINDARGSMQSARSDLARTNEDLPKIELRLSRQKTQEVVAPKDGIITRLLVSHEAEFVKEGKPLCVLIPESGRRAVELWVDGNDIPLLADGRDARIMFQGWPALQISGWPEHSYGTFPARIKFIDNADDGHGKFRVLLIQDEKSEDQWPATHMLRQGVRARGWIFMNRVTVGYEIWRKFNDFPPEIPMDARNPEKKGDSK